MVRNEESVTLRLPARPVEAVRNAYLVIAVRSSDRQVLAYSRGSFTVRPSDFVDHQLRVDLPLEPPETTLALDLEQSGGTPLVGFELRIQMQWGRQDGGLELADFGPAHGLLENEIVWRLMQEGRISGRVRRTVRTDERGMAVIPAVPAPCLISFQGLGPGDSAHVLQAVSGSLIAPRREEPAFATAFLVPRSGERHHATLTLSRLPRLLLHLPDAPLLAAPVGTRVITWLEREGKELPFSTQSVLLEQDRLSLPLKGLPDGARDGIRIRLVVIVRIQRGDGLRIRTDCWPLESSRALTRTIRIQPGTGVRLAGSFRHSRDPSPERLLIESSLGYTFWVYLDRLGRFSVPDLGMSTASDREQRFRVVRAMGGRLRLELGRPVPLEIARFNRIVLD